MSAKTETRAEHTAGPWSAGVPRMSETYGLANIDIRSSAPDEHASGQWVASCPGKNVGNTAAETRANARLVAAAPELLEAAEGIEAVYAEYMALEPEPGDALGLVMEKVRQAREAIAKARGRDEPQVTVRGHDGEAKVR